MGGVLRNLGRVLAIFSISVERMEYKEVEVLAMLQALYYFLVSFS